MKKILLKTLAIFMAVMIFQLQAMAGSTLSISSTDEAAVNFDETEIYSSFDEVNNLVSYVSENENVTYADAVSFDKSMVENVSSSAALALNNSNAGDPPFVGAFIWGCVLNWVGILIVALTTDMDKDQIMKSVWGCVAGTAIIVVFELIYVVALGGSYWWAL